MVHHLCSFRTTVVGCRGCLTLYFTNVPAYAFPANIFACCTVQLFRHHVRLYDHAVFRQITRKICNSFFIISLTNCSRITNFNDFQTAGVLGNFAVTILSLMYFIQVFIDDSSSISFWLVSLLSPTGVALAMDKVGWLDSSRKLTCVQRYKAYRILF